MIVILSKETNLIDAITTIEKNKWIIERSNIAYIPSIFSKKILSREMTTYMFNALYLIN